MISEVLLVESEAERIKAMAAERDPFETGGILLGLLADGEPWVTSAIEVPAADPHPTRYELPAGVTHRLIGEAREQDPRLGYIGDWHSHLGDAGPSGFDLRTLGRLARHAIRRHEPSPVLMVVRKSEVGWMITVSVPAWPLARAVPLVLTGPPNSATSLGPMGSGESQQP